MRKALLGILLAPVFLLASAGNMGAPIEKLVHKELVRLPYYSVFDNIAFQVQGDTVTLTGEVQRPTLRKEAERVVSRVEGVNQVVNRIEVLPLSPYDNRLRIGVLRAVYSQPALQKYALGAHPSIHVIVKNGEVRLEGVVLNEADRNIAFLRANGVAGVFAVINNLRVEQGRT